jgi:hypothetical protein
MKNILLTSAMFMIVSVTGAGAFRTGLLTFNQLRITATSPRHY